jgi:hypothetical protein
VRQWWRARCLPCWRHGAGLHGCLALDVPRPSTRGRAGPADTDTYGWHRHPADAAAEDERRRLDDLVRWQYRDVLGTFRLAASSVHALHALIDLCRRDGVPVALLLMPESAEFRALYPPAVRQGLDQFLAGLAREETVPLIDARTWIADDGFLDGHHLLPDGAAAFTDRFGRDAVEPLLNTLTGRPVSP